MLTMTMTIYSNQHTVSVETENTAASQAGPLFQNRNTLAHRVFLLLRYKTEMTEMWYIVATARGLRQVWHLRTD